MVQELLKDGIVHHVDHTIPVGVVWEDIIYTWDKTLGSLYELLVQLFRYVALLVWPHEVEPCMVQIRPGSTVRP